MKTNKKPKIKLIGHDGNAFNVLAIARKAAVKANWPTKEINNLFDEALGTNSYDEFLQVIMKYFEVS